MVEDSSHDLNYVIGLAKAREVLLHDVHKHMPAGALSQQQQILASLEGVIDRVLRESKIDGKYFTPPAQTDEITAKAYEYISSRPILRETANDSLSPYEHLKQVFSEIANSHRAVSILHWLKQSGAMPELSDDLMHEITSAITESNAHSFHRPALAEWIQQAKAEQDTLPPLDKRNLELMVYEWGIYSRLDASLEHQWEEAALKCNQGWESHKDANDYVGWLPSFRELISTTQQKAQALAQVMGGSAYDGMLDYFNPGITNQTVDRLFGQLTGQLPDLINRAIVKQSQDVVIPLPVVPEQVAHRVLERLMKQLGFDSSNLKLGISGHPFTIGDRLDVRMTKGRQTDNLLMDILDVMHEAGHAMYAKNLPTRNDQPIDTVQSTWIDESQALLWEMQIARSKPFMELVSGIIKDELRAAGLSVEGPEWSAENLYRLATRVDRDLIRTQANEVTYPAHIVLRHHLEQKLLDGSLEPKDLPTAWNQQMKALIGVDVPSDTKGCMQDSHWGEGEIGYFPAYGLGMLAAAQLMEKMHHDMPDIDANIASGEFAPIDHWLKDKIHQHGSFYEGEQLIENATGKPLSADAWLRHIQDRYINPPWRERVGADDLAARTWAKNS